GAMGTQPSDALRSLRVVLVDGAANTAPDAMSATSADCQLPGNVEWTRRGRARRWLPALFLCAGSILAGASHAAGPYAANACLVARGGTGCVANDGSIASIVLNGGTNLPGGVNPSSCTAGTTITVDLLVTLGSINASNRSDVGLYFAQDGKAMSVASPTGATACSVLTTPVPAGSPPVNGTFPSPFTGTWSNLDGNASGA